MDSLELVKAKLLFKLARRRNWGNSHTAFDNLKKGFKSREHLLVKRAAEELIKENIIKKNWVFRKLYSMVYKPLKTHLLSLINAWVPSDEGDLRRAIAKSVTQRGGSQLKGFPFLVMLNSRGVEYGKVVDNMPTSWLKHGGSGDDHHLLGRRTKSRHPPHNVLRDPKAKSHFY